MSFLYNGFSTEAMLNFMANHKDTHMVNLDYCGSKGWQLAVYNDCYGEFEMIGTIPQIMMKAFKPYLKQAKAECAEFQKLFSDIQQKVGGRTISVDMANGPDQHAEMIIRKTRIIGHVPKDRPLLKCKHGTILYGMECLNCKREKDNEK